jgi:Escherichia/Staphylococcus phage prohead protease
MKAAARFSIPLAELKAVGSDLATGELNGYAATWQVDRLHDRIVPGAFAASLKSHRENGTAIPMLWNHSVDDVIGQWTDLREDKHGLAVRGRLALGVARADDARVLAKAGILAMSIGYRAVKATYTDSVRELRQVELFEISLTAVPVNPGAKIVAAKSFRPNSVRSLEDALHEYLGFSRREAKAMAGPALRALEQHDSSNEVIKLLNAAAHSLTLKGI